jgi:hypothetical protein
MRKIREHFYTEPSLDYADLAVVDEREVRLEQVALEVGARFSYDNDFGDNWQHALVVEQMITPDPSVAYPRCIAGKRACPPEDVGGVPGSHTF